MEIFSQIWNSIIIEPMINSLVLLYGISYKNFGLAIVLFTILIRGLLMPLTVKQSKQMKGMSALSPKIKAIQLKYEGNFKDGKAEGLSRWWYENGQLESEINNLNGKLDGLSRTWHENGQLATEVNIKNDKPVGPTKMYDSDGRDMMPPN